MEEQAVELLRGILEIYSPSGGEAALAQFVADKMERLLLFDRVRIDGVGNVIGELGSGNPSTLLCGHMDTVPGRQPTLVEGGRIYGRGACDAKSALSAMLVAASLFGGDRAQGRVIVACEVDEEGRGTGVRSLVDGQSKTDFAIFGEPSGVEKITIAYKGRVMARIACRTQGGHASSPWVSENSVIVAMELYRKVEQDLGSSRAGGDQFSKPSVCLTRINGGSSHNVIPSRCSMALDIRVPLGMGCEYVASLLRRCIREEASRGASFQLRIHEMTEPFEADRGSVLVRAMVRSILRQRGRRPMLVKKTGTGDMNILGKAWGIPIITYGPGDPGQSHTDKESVSIKDYLDSIQVIRGTLVELSQLAA